MRTIKSGCKGGCGKGSKTEMVTPKKQNYGDRRGPVAIICDKAGTRDARQRNH